MLGFGRNFIGQNTVVVPVLSCAWVGELHGLVYCMLSDIIVV